MNHVSVKFSFSEQLIPLLKASDIFIILSWSALDVDTVQIVVKKRVTKFVHANETFMVFASLME